jgi:ADP-ribose pyrophosphatase YjhB (NUDIX family)/predicted transcriptional regulator
MDNINIKLHRYQQQILKQITLNKGVCKFNDLLIEGLESEHMNYHLKKLVNYKLVRKDKNGYTLTDKGKDYSNMLDDNIEFVEQQPKTSVIIQAVRKNEKGEVEHLLCKRKRHPYYGKVGRLTGKVRFGETLIEAAQRELNEETGLTAKNMELNDIYHKMRHKEDGTFIQDVIFYIFLATDLEGNLIQETESQINMWKTKKEAFANEDLYDDMVLSDDITVDELKFTESVDLAEGF